MEKIEFLNKLEEVVKNEVLLKARYKQEIDGKECYCIVGHAYKILGKENILNELADIEIGILSGNAAAYSAIPARFQIHKEIGLTESDFFILQRINDNVENKEEELLRYIKKLKEKESN